MSTAEYGRRAAAPSPRGPPMSGICIETSGDYNQFFKSQELPSTSMLATNHRGGPRPLEWRVGAATAAGTAPAPAADAVQWGLDSAHQPFAGPSMLQQQAVMSKAVYHGRNTYSPVGMGRAAPTTAVAAGTAELPAASTGIPAASKRNMSAGCITDRTMQTPARTSIVLGSEVAGYKSVITKNPVSPSGYSIAQPEAATPPSAAPLPAPAFAGRTSGTRSSAAQPASRYTPSLSTTADTDMPGSSADNSRALAGGPGSSSSTAAAAAAAALAALGNRGRISSVAQASPVAAAPARDMPAQACSNGSYSSTPQYSLADVSAAEAGTDQHSSWTSAALQAHAGPAALKWNVQEQPRSHTLQPPAAGRRTGNNSPSRSRAAVGSGLNAGLGLSTAVELDPTAYNLEGSGGGYGPSSGGGYAPTRSATMPQQRGYSPSNYTNNGSSNSYAADNAAAGGPGARPPSQQLSEGLSKLKLLSRDRLASRLTTPPGNAASTADGTGSSNSKGSSSARPEGRSGRNVNNSASSDSGSSRYSSAPSGRARGGSISQHPQQQLQQEIHGCGFTSSSTSTYTPSIGPRLTNSRGRSVGGAAALADTAARGSSGAIQLTVSRGQNEAGFGLQFGAGLRYMTSDSVAQHADEGQFEQQGPLQPCANCGRSFNLNALERHVKVCAKVFCEKRKVFNMQSQRLQGSEAAKFAASSSTSCNRRHQQLWTTKGGQGSKSGSNRQQQLDSRPTVSAAAAKKSKWQQQSEQLRAAMRANHSSNGGSATGFGGPMPSEPVEDNRIPCPHCGRRFAELAAERHIPKCSEIRAKPTGLKAGGGKGAYMRSNSKC